MTLIIVAGNKNFAVLSADRRLTTVENGVPIVKDEESTKTTILACYNARVSVAYTGLATWKFSTGEYFSTEKWLLESLQMALDDNNKIIPTLEFIKLKASKDFNKLGLNSPLLFIFFGYLYSTKTELKCWTISNFQWIDSKPILNLQSEFLLTSHKSDKESGIIFKTGADKKIDNLDLLELKDILKSAKSSDVIQEKIYDTIKKVATNDNLVGKQSNCCVIHRSVNRSMKATYYSNYATDTMYSANAVLGGQGGAMISYGMSITGRLSNAIGFIQYSFPDTFPSGSKQVVESFSASSNL